MEQQHAQIPFKAKNEKKCEGSAEPFTIELTLFLLKSGGRPKPPDPLITTPLVRITEVLLYSETK